MRPALAVQAQLWPLPLGNWMQTVKFPGHSDGSEIVSVM